MENNILKKNFIYAFIAQLITLVVSCLTNLILPKIISPLQYSYWQLFIFYASYIPCLAFGINDGIYLRLGGSKIQNLNYKSIKSQYIFGQFFQFTLVIILATISLFLFGRSYRNTIILLTLIYFISYTTYNFFSYIYQAVNLTNIASKAIIIFQLIYLLFQIIFIFLKLKNAFQLIVMYIIANFCATLYLLYRMSKYLRGIPFNYHYGKDEAFISMKTGISLMIANVCSMLILGIGRQIIDMRWGLLKFGKVSFSLALINFALTFIVQIGIVLFPALRRLNNKDLKKVYIKLNKNLFLWLPIIYLLFFPGQYILSLWLPKYTESIIYLGMTLPICFFDCKMNLLDVTYFKVLNKQILLLEVNILTVLFSLVLCGITAYFFNNLNFVIYSLVMSIAFRCTISDYVLGKFMKVKTNQLILLDWLLAIVFIATQSLGNSLYSAMIISIIILSRIGYNYMVQPFQKAEFSELD